MPGPFGGLAGAVARGMSGADEIERQRKAEEDRKAQLEISRMAQMAAFREMGIMPESEAPTVSDDPVIQGFNGLKPRAVASVRAPRTDPSYKPLGSAGGQRYVQGPRPAEIAATRKQEQQVRQRIATLRAIAPELDADAAQGIAIDEDAFKSVIAERMKPKKPELPQRPQAPVRGTAEYLKAIADEERVRAGFKQDAVPAVRPPTEPQEKSYLFYTLMQNAQPDIDAAMSSGKVRADRVTAYLRAGPLDFLANRALSPEEQKLIRAAREFAAGVLRKESGAAVTKDELNQVWDRYFITSGDKPELDLSKADARQAYMDSMAEMAGPALTYYQKRREGQPTAQASPQDEFSDAEVLEAYNAGHTTDEAIANYIKGKRGGR